MTLTADARSPTGRETMSSALPDAVNYHDWIMDKVRGVVAGDALLEIGPGYGQYTRPLSERVDRLVALDIDPECVRGLAGIADNVEPRLGDLNDPAFASRVGEGRFGYVLCLNVLEHIEDDVRALRNMGAVLRPGGKLLLLVPAHPSLYGAMDRLAGHHRRYTRKSLRSRLAAAGLHVDELSHFNAVGGVGWWVNARFFKPRDLSAPSINRQILLFDRYALPLSRMIDPFTRGFFGQSLWVVARRPGGAPREAAPAGRDGCAR